jgi:hypothetical protein
MSHAAPYEPRRTIKSHAALLPWTGSVIQFEVRLYASILASQEVSSVDDLAGRELRLHQLADWVHQLVHQTHDDLSGGIVLHDEVCAMAVVPGRTALF